MEAPLAELDLSRFDRVDPIELDHTVCSANLAALHEVDPASADAIAEATIPEHWRAVRGLDGAPTFRIERPGEMAAWFGGTAAPDARARGLVGLFRPEHKNPALPCVGAGGEIRLLLQRLEPHVALYVFETDPVAVHAALQLVDVAAAIRMRRLILAPPGVLDAASNWLVALLDREPGLLAPGTILTPSLVPAERCTAVRELCEGVSTEVTARRARAFAALSEQLAEMDGRVGPDACTTRLAIIAPTISPTVRRDVELLGAQAERLGWTVARAVVRGPLDVHLLAHARRAVDAAPAMNVWLGQGPGALPVRLPGFNAIWVRDADEAATLVGASATDNLTYLAASPRIAAALQSAGVADDAILPWYWAADQHEPAHAAAGPGAAVLLVGDLPDTRPESHGMELDSQRMLAQALLTVAERLWETPPTYRPEGILAAAERAAGIRVEDAALRADLLAWIERVVMPAVVLEQVWKALQSSGRPIRVVGHGWNRIAGATESGTTDIDAILADAASVPCGVILAGSRDPLTSGLVRVAARGWPVLLHAGAERLSEALGGVLEPGRHIATFCTRRDILRGVESLKEPATLRRATAAVDDLRRGHTWTHRLTALAARAARRT